MGKGGYKLESAYGSGGTPVSIFLPIISTDMKPNIEKIASPAMFGSRNTQTYYHGKQDPSGSVTLMADPDNIATFVYAALGAEAAAAQVLATSAYDHVFTPAASTVDLPSFAMEIDREGTCSLYTGCVVNEFTLSASLGNPLQCILGLFAKTEADDQSATTLSPSTKLPYLFSHGIVKVDTTQKYYVNSLEFKYSNEVDSEGGFTLNGTAYRHHAYKTTGICTGTMECEWTSDSDALRDAYMDNTSVKLEFIFTSTETIEAGYYYTLSIEVPIAKILGEPPNLSDRGRTPFTVNFEAIYDVTNYIKITHRDARTTKWSA
jgi:hypothetical protein